MKKGGRKTEAAESLQAAAALMREAGIPPLAIEEFSRNYRRLTEGEQLLIGEEAISPVEELPALEHLGSYSDAGRKALDSTVIFKLNGGLGTSMGLDRAKSLLPAKKGLTFLDIILGQIIRLRRSSGSRMPLVLMNSFSTDADTCAVLAENSDFRAGQKDIPTSFLQHRVPKIDRATMRPVESPGAPDKAWCPPGHGDFYTALLVSGVLHNLLAEGFEYGFISNADNLGASLDLNLLGYFADQHCPFLMEVTRRTEADRKGGHLAYDRSGHLILRERAQCPESDLASFTDCGKHRFFNTNNLWINLKALSAKLEESGGLIELPLIANRKTLDPSDPSSTEVYQLETAMGAAVSVFEDARAVMVPRRRFAPVKTTNDLLALWSDVYVVTDDMEMVYNPDRKLGPIVIDLDPEHYRTITSFSSHFPDGAPSLVDCERLIIKGKFTFDPGVVLRGQITLYNQTRHDIIVPEGTLLQAE